MVEKVSKRYALFIKFLAVSLCISLGINIYLYQIYKALEISFNVYLAEANKQVVNMFEVQKFLRQNAKAIIKGHEEVIKQQEKQEEAIKEADPDKLVESIEKLEKYQQRRKHFMEVIEKKALDLNNTKELENE